MASDELSVELLNQLMILAGRVTGSMQEGLERLDLTETLANLLWNLRPDGDPLPLRKLADLLHCDPSNITVLSVKLEERGLAERRPHPADGRVRTLVLTGEGVRLRTRLVAMVTKRTPLAGLDEKERKQLQALLAKAIAVD
jgi:MarR family transcriptional regulator, organic hydroperoxide resistance regulator